MKKYDVVGVGLNIIDLLFISPENVVADGKQFVEDFVMQGGAPIGSAVSAIARMGYKAAFAARMDNSALSSIARSELRSNNISDDLVITDSKSKPAIAIVSIDKKTSGRTVYIGMKDYGFLRKKDIPVEAIRNSKLLMADSYDFDATEAALAAAAKCGCRSLVDFEYGDKKRTLKLIGMATDIVLPLECACRLSGKKRRGKRIEGSGEIYRRTACRHRRQTRKLGAGSRRNIPPGDSPGKRKRGFDRMRRRFPRRIWHRLDRGLGFAAANGVRSVAGEPSNNKIGRAHRASF